MTVSNQRYSLFRPKQGAPRQTCVQQTSNMVPLCTVLEKSRYTVPANYAVKPNWL